MNFLLEFNEYNSLLLEHYYDSVVNQFLGLPTRKKSQLYKLLDYINRMINEKQVKDKIKSTNEIEFTIKKRKYVINKSGTLTLFKIKSTDYEVKNIDILDWIFNNHEESLTYLNTFYSGRIRTVNKTELDRLRELNNKIGKRSELDFNNTFKSAKKHISEEIRVNIQIDNIISSDLFNKLS